MSELLTTSSFESSTDGERSVKFLPAFFLPVVERGQEFTSGALPLHITLFPPILAAYERRFGDEMRNKLNEYAPFTVTAAGEGRFGPNQDIPVRLLEPSLSMQGMHAMLEVAIGGLLHDATYRRPYNPHITVADFSEVSAKQDITIGGLSIVEKVADGSWKVVDKIGLKGGNNE